MRDRSGMHFDVRDLFVFAKNTAFWQTGDAEVEEAARSCFAQKVEMLSHSERGRHGLFIRCATFHPTST